MKLCLRLLFGITRSPHITSVGIAASRAGIISSATLEQRRHGNGTTFNFSNSKDGTGNVVSVDSSKAGMEKVDKERVNAIINEASKGTPFYINEQRKAQARQQRVAKLQEKSREFSTLGKDALRELRTRVVTLEEQLEATRSLRPFVHVDMDMFYAAVEEKLNPALRNVPFGVGSTMMLSTTNYLARQFGVRAGMPGFLGLKLCPTLVIVPANFPAYRKVTEVVRGIAKDYDPDYASLGLDELTMDVNAYLVAHPGMTAADVAREVRERIVTATGLTASCGIAPTAVLAKMASNYEKPNGQHELVLKTREEVIAYMRPLEVRQVPGIGRATTDVLNGLGIRTCGELYDDRVRMAFLFPGKTFERLVAVGLGVMKSFAEDGRDARQQPKSISHASTVVSLLSPHEMRSVVMYHVGEVHKKLLADEVAAQQVGLVLKTKSYIPHEQTKTIPGGPTQDQSAILRTAMELVELYVKDFSKYRLVGVKVSKLIPVDEIGAPRPAEEKETQKKHSGKKKKGTAAQSKAASEKEAAKAIAAETPPPPAVVAPGSKSTPPTRSAASMRKKTKVRRAAAPKTETYVKSSSPAPAKTAKDAKSKSGSSASSTSSTPPRRMRAVITKARKSAAQPEAPATKASAASGTKASAAAAATAKVSKETKTKSASSVPPSSTPPRKVRAVITKARKAKAAAAQSASNAAKVTPSAKKRQRITVVIKKMKKADVAPAGAAKRASKTTQHHSSHPTKKSKK